MSILKNTVRDIMLDLLKCPETKEVLKEVFLELAYEERFKKSMRGLLKSIAVSYIGNTVFDQMFRVISIFCLAFIFWIFNSGFLEWVTEKGMM